MGSNIEHFASSVFTSIAGVHCWRFININILLVQGVRLVIQKEYALAPWARHGVIHSYLTKRAMTAKITTSNAFPANTPRATAATNFPNGILSYRRHQRSRNPCVCAASGTRENLISRRTYSFRQQNG